MIVPQPIKIAVVKIRAEVHRKIFLELANICLLPLSKVPPKKELRKPTFGKFLKVRCFAHV